MLQLWELASGRLKLTLTGHISTVRALTVSHRQPYLFSAGEDKQVKCWDLEYNKVGHVFVFTTYNILKIVYEKGYKVFGQSFISAKKLTYRYVLSVLRRFFIGGAV